MNNRNNLGWGRDELLLQGEIASSFTRLVHAQSLPLAARKTRTGRGDGINSHSGKNKNVKFSSIFIHLLSRCRIGSKIDVSVIAPPSRRMGKTWCHAAFVICLTLIFFSEFINNELKPMMLLQNAAQSNATTQKQSQSSPATFR